MSGDSIHLPKRQEIRFPLEIYQKKNDEHRDLVEYNTDASFLSHFEPAMDLLLL